MGTRTTDRTLSPGGSIAIGAAYLGTGVVFLTAFGREHAMGGVGTGVGLVAFGLIFILLGVRRQRE